MRLLYLCLILVLVAVIAFGQDYDEYWIKDFSGGLQTELAPTVMPDNYALELENAVFEGTSIKIRHGFSSWATRIDTALDGSVPSPVRPIRKLYDFYDETAKKRQLLALIHDNMWFRGEDSTRFWRVGYNTWNGNLLLVDNDSIAYGIGSDWLMHVIPEDGRDWRLYIYSEGGTGTYSFDIYRILGNNHLKLDAANTSGNFQAIEDFGIVPSFDTVSYVDVSNNGTMAFISDGVHPCRKWDGAILQNGHYIVDSAVVSSILYTTYEGRTVLQISLSTPLSQPYTVVENYALYNYCIVYDKLQAYPYTDGKPAFRSPIYDVNSTRDTIYIFTDLKEQVDLYAGQKIYVVPPMNEGYAFNVDTVFSGVVDSIVQYDTAASYYMVIDTVLTQFRDTTIAEDADSVEITLDISYNSVNDYQVVFSYGAAYESRFMVRKVDTDVFRLIRPPIDNTADQDIHWIAIGIPADADSADSHADGNNWLWQWGLDTLQYIKYPPISSNKDTVTLTYSYSSTALYSIGLGPISQVWFNLDGSKNGLPYAEKNAVNQLYYYDSEWWHPVYQWVTVGDADVSAEANSDDDSLLVQWGLDTLGVGIYAKDIWFDDVYTRTPRLAFSCVDTNAGSASDTIENRIVWQFTSGSRFRLAREFANVAQIVSWIAVGSQSRTGSDTNYITLVFDDEVITDDSIGKNQDFYTAPHLFKITDGPGSEDAWWSTGTPCVLYRTEDDSLALRILMPPLDFDSAAVEPLPSDSSSYLVLHLGYYPQSLFAIPRQNRMWFIGGQAFPKYAWYSSLSGAADLIAGNYFDNVSTVDYEIIGVGDNDEMIAANRQQQWLTCYERNHIYSLSNNDKPYEIYEKSSGYGLWSSSVMSQYMENTFGLHRLGMFAFDGSTLVPHSGVSEAVRSFFTDSLNLSEAELAASEIYENQLILSFPSGSNTQNTKTLVCDLRTGAWATWTLLGSTYLKLQSPNGLDTLLFGSPDSATIFVMGGTDDAGAEIEMTYKSPYLDFNLPTWEKQVRKVHVTCKANSGCSLSVAIYADDLTTAEYTGTLVCDTDLGYDSPQSLVLDLPESIEPHTHYSVKLTSINADSLKISKLGLQYTKIQEVGSQ